MGIVEELYKIKLYDPTLTAAIPLGIENIIYDEILGMEMPPVERFLVTSRLQQGGSDYGFKLSERLMRVKVKIKAATPKQYYERREELTKVVRPYANLLPSILEAELPDSSKWRLQVFCTSLKFHPYQKDAPYTQLVEFDLMAPSPSWYQYNVSIDTIYYQEDIPSTKIIYYTGSWIVYPYPFSIRGPITHPIINNLTTGKKIDINYTIPNNKTVLIDLRDGFKTIMLEETSLLPYLTADSHLGTFYLLPEPEAINGENYIKIEGSGVNQNTRIIITYTPTKIGI